MKEPLKATTPQLAPVVTGFQHSVPPPPNVDILSADSFAELLANSANSPSSTLDPPQSDNLDALASGEIIALAPSSDEQQASEHEEPTATIYQDSGNVIVAVDHNMLANQEAALPPKLPKRSDDCVDKHDDSDSILPFAEPVLPLVTAAPVPEVPMAKKKVAEEAPIKKPKEENENMSASMQSLVDGLMTWGGQFEADDVFALPQGMAASIAFEESVTSNPQGTF